MPLRRFLALLCAVILALLASPAVTGSALASASAGVRAAKPGPSPTMVAQASNYVAPGRTTRIQVGYYYDGYLFQEVSGARFTSSNRRVLTVSKAGMVTGVALGDAT